MEAAVAGYERKAKVKGSCCNDAVGHVGNNVARNRAQGTSNVVIQWKDCESGIVLAQFADKPLECIGGDAPTFDRVHNLNERDGLNVRWHTTGRCAINYQK